MSNLPLSGSIALGVDLGTSSIKIVALRPDGTLLGESAATFATHGPLPLQAEQEPREWLSATSEAMHALDRVLSAAVGTDWKAQVAVIGLTGQLPTLVCLDASGVVGSAITWKDGRADAWAAARLDAARRREWHARTGMPIDGRYLAPMLQFHFADRIADLRSILSAKDFLFYELTGLKYTEPSTAAGYGIFDLQSGEFAADLAAFWQLPMDLLPQLRPAAAVAGELTSGGAALLGLPEGVPVSIGAADSMCASFAMAGLDERIVAISFGSSAVIVGASPLATRDPSARYLTTPHAVSGWFGREMDLLASGTGYQWLSDLFGWQDGDLDRNASYAAPGANGLTFTPYLAGGEQGALWNPNLMSCLFGLSLKSTRNDIARAFLEGVFYEIRRCIEVLAEDSAVASICVSGNIVNAPSSLQLLADIAQKPVAAYRHKSPAALGAALLATQASAHRPANDRPANDRAPDVTQPDAARAAVYSAAYRQYLARARACE